MHYRAGLSDLESTSAQSMGGAAALHVVRILAMLGTMVSTSNST
ncbi:hypothetical protein [Pyrobaculum islandicum]|nr:hypothetical protein [Pyrobaculum islandicum]